MQQLLHYEFVMFPIPLQAQPSCGIFQLKQNFEDNAVPGSAATPLVPSHHLSYAVDSDRFQPCPKRSGSLTVKLDNSPSHNGQNFLDSIVGIVFLQPYVTLQPASDQRRINSQQPRPCLTVGLPSNSIQQAC